MQKIAHKTVVITGAGSGLGRALALQFANNDWQVMCSDMNLQSARETVALIEAEGQRGIANQCDITSADDLLGLKVQISEQFEGLGVLINNAGIAAGGALLDTDMTDIDWVLEVDLRAQVLATKTLAPILVEQGSGHIVNIASFAGLAQAPGMVAYNIAKSGVISLSESIRGEMAQFGVGVSVACPAFFQTNLTERFRSPDPRQRVWVEKVMDRSSTTAQDVARDVFEAVRKRRFMVLSHPDTKRQYWLKRLLPETFARKVIKSMTPRSK